MFKSKLIALLICLLFMCPFTTTFAESTTNETNNFSLSNTELLALVTEDYIRDTRETATNVIIPLSNETIKRIKNVFEADRIIRFGPYETKLREMGVTDEARILFSSREWYARDNSDVVKKYLTEDMIFDYALTGEADTVFCDNNGNPLFRKLNMNEKASKACDAGIKLIYDAGVTNIYDAIRDSGMCICCVNEVPVSSTACVVDACGAIFPNMGEKELSLADKNLSYLYARIFGVEPTFVGCLQVMGSLGVDSMMSDVDFINSCGVMKDNIGYYLVASLEGQLFSVLKGTYFADAEIYAKNLGTSVDDQEIKRKEAIIYEAIEVLGEPLIKARN